MSIKEARIELSTDCVYDYLEIYDGGDAGGFSIGKLCGEITKTFLSSSNQISFVFSSDVNFEDIGFLIEYRLHAPRIADCNQTLNASEGHISSPEFPGNYLAERECFFFITVPDVNLRVKLEFEELVLESSAGCTGDFVEIRDGFSQDADVLGRFCVQMPDTPIITSTNRALVHFSLVYGVKRRGFRIRFSTVGNRVSIDEDSQWQQCPWLNDNDTGAITSPNYPNSYDAGTKCSVIIRAPLGYQIRLTFQYFELEPDDLCQFDSVEIRDGPPIDWQVLGRFCGDDGVGKVLLSTTDIVTVVFTSDDFAEHTGFKLIYEFVAAEDDSLDSEGTALELPDAEQLDDLIVGPQNMSVVKGYSFMLHCLARNRMTPIIWLKDRTIISDSDTEVAIKGLQVLSNGSLLVSEMRSEFQGVYTCVLLSPGGALVNNAWVTLNDSFNQDCDIEFLKKPTDTTLYEGQHALLSCYASNAVMRWYKESDEILDTTGRVQILVNSFLLIDRVQVSDSGTYECSATARKGACSKVVSVEVVVIPKPDITSICGLPQKPRAPSQESRSKNRSGKIISGQSASKGSFPWQAMLWELWAGAFCGGALVSEEWIVTAAHCIVEFQDRFARSLRIASLVVKLGKNDQNHREVEEAIVNVAKVITHPRFDQVSYDNDIAMVRLSRKVRFTDYILPICVGTRNFLEENVYTRNVSGTVTGWGLMAEDGSWPMRLQQITLPLVDHDKCVESTAYPVTENMYCAGYEKRVIGDACKGDSGGPFAVQVEARWYLAGLVSWGEGCDREGKYGFYLKVGNYIAWMKHIMITHGI